MISFYLWYRFSSVQNSAPPLPPGSLPASQRAKEMYAGLEVNQGIPQYEMLIFSPNNSYLEKGYTGGGNIWEQGQAPPFGISPGFP